MKRIGVTGGIGSGKTTVCRILAWMDVPVYYADERAKTLMQEEPELIRGIKALLGAAAYEEGKLNRPYIASLVFKDAELLKGLNALVHPAVERDFENWCEKMESEGHAFVLKEAALLVETGSYKDLDALVVVSAEDEVRIARVMARDGVSREQVMDRMRNQMPQSEKEALADHIIKNDGREGLLDQLIELHRCLNEQAVS